MHDANRRREETVESRTPAIDVIARDRNIDVSALCQRVDAGISATGSMNAHLLGTNTSKSIFEMVLNAIAIRLTLPTRKRRAVVRDH